MDIGITITIIISLLFIVGVGSILISMVVDKDSPKLEKVPIDNRYQQKQNEEVYEFIQDDS